MQFSYVLFQGKSGLGDLRVDHDQFLVIESVVRDSDHYIFSACHVVGGDQIFKVHTLFIVVLDHDELAGNEGDLGSQVFVH